MAKTQVKYLTGGLKTAFMLNNIPCTRAAPKIECWVLFGIIREDSSKAGMPWMCLKGWTQVYLGGENDNSGSWGHGVVNQQRKCQVGWCGYYKLSEKEDGRRWISKLVHGCVWHAKQLSLLLRPYCFPKCVSCSISLRRCSMLKRHLYSTLRGHKSK